MHALHPHDARDAPGVVDTDGRTGRRLDHQMLEHTHRTASHRLANLLATARNGEKERGGRRQDSEESSGIVLSIFVCISFTCHTP
jgi:hypothetical protein